jgi:hypothetical protein
VSLGARLQLGLLVLDAVLLALLEMFYLPLRLSPERGGWMLPVSIVLAALSTPLLVVAGARLTTRLLVATAPLSAWVLTIGGIGLDGPGGDVVLPQDYRTLLLFAAGMLPSGVLIGRMTGRAALPAGPVYGPGDEEDRGGARNNPG